jgi:hypothetical protein
MAFQLPKLGDSSSDAAAFSLNLQSDNVPTRIGLLTETQITKISDILYPLLLKGLNMVFDESSSEHGYLSQLYYQIFGVTEIGIITLDSIKEYTIPFFNRLRRKYYDATLLQSDHFDPYVFFPFLRVLATDIELIEGMGKNLPKDMDHNSILNKVLFS